MEDCPKSPTKMEDMFGVSYVSVVGNLMYVMGYTSPNISQVMGVLSQYIANPGRVHWDIFS